MSSRRLNRKSGGDNGAVAVIVAVSLILLFLVTALAIDLGFARADVRHNQSVSDFAGIAAARSLSGGHQAACLAAVDYVFANSEALTSGSSEHDDAKAQCSAFAGLDVEPGCTDETPSHPEPIEAGPYTITITMPVDDADPAMTVEGQPIVELDGLRCERVKVSVVRERSYIFAPAAGLTGGSAHADAVAVWIDREDPDDIASLIVLEQKDCDALTTSGTGAMFEVRDRDVEFPGLIVADSDGTSQPRGSGSNCRTGTRHVINHGSGTICAEGGIGSYALGGGDASKSHPGSGTDECPTGLGRFVEPRTQRIGRKGVDWLVNCQDSYPSYSSHQRYPFYGDTPRCPDPPLRTPPLPARPPFLDNLFDELQSGSLPADWLVIDDCSGDLTNGASTKVHVRCSPGPHTNSITFTGVTHVVFNHPVPQQVSTLVVRGNLPEGAIVYFRDAGIRRTQNGSSTVLENVFAYVNTRNGLGVDTNGGNVTWRSVLRDPDAWIQNGCVLDALPVASCFAPLALWSNSNSEHTFGGNGSQTIVGSYFIPNAHIKFHGGGTADFEDAQFFGRTMEALGGAQVTLVPNPETGIPVPVFRLGLIR